MKIKLSHLFLATSAALLSFVFIGCSKFLDVAPSSTAVNPTRIKDFQEMLNNDSIAHAQFFLLDIMSDDILLYNNWRNSNTIYSRSYLWGDTIWNPAESDFIYNSSYQRILQMNIILDRLPQAPKDEMNTEENRLNVRSQALIHRAWYYLQLVNTYGKDYTEETATEDLGVPLVLVPDPNLLLPRASVAEVYDQIVTDLHIAVNNPYLPSKGVDIIHPGKAAGYALLARTYLYMEQYDRALAYADSSLSLVNTLLDYNTQYTPLSRLFDLAGNPEILMGKITSDINVRSYYTNTFAPTTELMDSLRSTPGGSLADTRYSQRFPLGFYLSSAETGGIVIDNSVRVPEVMLIKAECLARAGRVDEAAELIEEIRINRIPLSDLKERVYTSANILSYVLGERRRELAYQGGLRWFDIKRLNNEPGRQIKLIRTPQSSTEIIAELEANSVKYVLPFSALVIAANPNIVQNPRK